MEVCVSHRRRSTARELIAEQLQHSDMLCLHVQLHRGPLSLQR